MLKFIRKRLNRKYTKEELIKKYEQQRLIDNELQNNGPKGLSACGGLSH
ncbi:MAG: hypothetical protein ACFFCY_12810 [Promethearchaeota archaeon]|jgi:hypothetical protein